MSEETEGRGGNSVETSKMARHLETVRLAGDPEVFAAWFANPSGFLRLAKPSKKAKDRTGVKRRKSPKKKTSAHRLKQECDALVRERVFERDGNKCVRCGRIDTLAPSHVYPKGKYQRLRFIEINILTLCYGCHIPWWHHDPVSAAEWFLKNWPERAAQLRMLKDTAPKVDVKSLLKELRETKGQLHV